MAGETKPRGVVSILAIGLFLGPFTLMLWLGRARAAWIYLTLAVASLALLFLSVGAGAIKPPMIAGWSMGDVVSLVFAPVVLAAIVHALWIRRKSLARPWFSRWFVALPLPILIGLLIALMIRTLLFQPFSIPSGSNVPNLVPGDYVFVSKTAYGYSRFSFPWGIVRFNGRLWGAAPERGDVAVFKLPSDGETDYIKRVIGLPGEHIQMRHGVLFINGEPVPRESAGDYDNADRMAAVGPALIPTYRETLPNGVSYLVLDSDPDGAADNTEEYAVPPGHYFMMGDNRDNSQDSRYLNAVGYVPEENFIGPAAFVFWNDQGLSLDRPKVPASPD